MSIKRLFILFISIVCFSGIKADGKINGFKGLWYTLTQFGEYGDKYSGGLGTYTAKHSPLAIYSAKENKTFFTYSGTVEETDNHLLIMISYYDHSTGQLAKPVILFDKTDSTDPHENATIQLDADGYLWVFISGRYSLRNGYILRSDNPYNIQSFSEVLNKPFNYPQPKYISGKGFLFLFTNLGSGRELYMQSSDDGYSWTSDKKMVAFGGHYQVSCNLGSKVGFAYNWHPQGNVDKRTNLYFMETQDMGKTWTNINGDELLLPIQSSNNNSLVKDYSSMGLNVYLKDIRYNNQGYPVLVYITSPTHLTGPANPKREWRIAQWDGNQWLFSMVTYANHNYDMGSLYFDDDNTYRIIAPTEVGPQQWGTGGEMATWESYDAGVTWNKLLDITSNSVRNHTYARRPMFCNPDFYALWADGNTEAFSRSCLYFTNKYGDVFQMPYDLEDDFVDPIPFADVIETFPQVVYASSYKNGFPAIKSIDGKISDESRWEVNNFPQHIIIDYGEDKEFNTAQLYTAQNRSYNYTIELSDDLDFSNDAIVNMSNNTTGTSPYRYSFSTTQARYAKLTVTGQNELQDRYIRISEFELLYDDSTQASDLELLTLRAYPNPATQDYFTLEGLKGGSSVEIYTVAGTMIYKEIVLGGTVKINCSSFPNGLVLVNVISADNKQTIKVLIKK